MTSDLFALPPAEPDRRPVLLAMNNPLSDDPHYALFPAPERCTGWRVWQMLATTALLREPPLVVTRTMYTSRFDRRNVLSARTWTARDARAAGAGHLRALSGRTVAVLGAATLDALRLPRPRDWGVWDEDSDIEYCLLPHPSGRCREYNDPAMRAMAGETLLRLYLTGRGR